MFISNAYAQAAGASATSGIFDMWPFLVMFAVLYFVMIRPQMKRQKEQKTMMDALAKGDEVVTAGGILGKVTKVTDTFVSLEIANGVEMQVQKSAITTLIPKGTMKGI